MSCRRRSRSGRWKLYRAEEHDFLFDLGSDLGERTNQASGQAGVVERLLGSMRRWESQMQPPRWTCEPAPHVWDVDGVRLKVCF